MSSRRFLPSCLTFAIAALVSVAPAHAQDEKPHRGRKYKTPPATSHIEVQVLKGTNQKPVTNAAVIFHSVKDGRDEGNMEVKTNDEGVATIDIIPTGSKVGVQVLADGFATFAQEYVVTEPSRRIEVSMLAPRAQVSTYVDTSGQASQRKWGVQEPVTPATAPVIQPPKPANHTSDPTPAGPVSPHGSQL